MWSLSFLCFLTLGIIDVRLPEPVLFTLVVALSSGPLTSLARRSFRTALLALLIILSECLLELMNVVLNTSLHAAAFQTLFALVLGSLAHAFAVNSTRRSAALVMAGILAALSATALIVAVVLFSAGSVVLPSGLPVLLAQLPLVNLLISLGALVTLWILPPMGVH